MQRGSTLALVARSVDTGESDRVITLLTEKMGKVAALARGARRSRRRFGAALGLFVVGDASLRAGRSSRALPHLERFELAENLAEGIACDVAKVAHGSYVLEVAREMWPAAQVDVALFGLVVRTLRALSGAEQADVLLLRAFELQLLSAVGLAPSLDRCVSCGVDLPDSGSYGFSATQGGVICSRCGPHGWPLTRATVDALCQLRRRPLEAPLSEPLTAATRNALRDVTRMLIGHHLGRGLRSVDFIERLNSAVR
jgi:DNA repair protein RecO (recombination protein O)